MSISALSSGDGLVILKPAITWRTSPARKAQQTVRRLKVVYDMRRRRPELEAPNEYDGAPLSLQELQGGVPPATTLDMTYSPLPLTEPKSTRVLRVLPPELQEGDTITCQLEVIQLDDDPPPEFSALSYVWGSPSKTRCITINNKPFVVRQNLWAFLDHMRKQAFSDLLWIDAICINQDCIPERNHQVAVMGDIFRMATRVLAWVGPESAIISPNWVRFNRPGESTPKIVKFLQAPVLDSIRLMVEELSIPLEGSVNRKVTENFRIFVLLLKNLGDLFSAVYWSRMWIVQEYILARDIRLLTDRGQMTGDELLSVWEALLNNPTIDDYRHPRNSLKSVRGPLRATFLDLDEEIKRNFKTVEFSKAVQTIERRKELHSTSRIKPLEDWVARFQDLGCFDPRDHVYALLSLTKPEDLAFYELSPDYGKSELLLYIQLAYGLWMRGDFTRALLFGSVLGIKAEAVVQVNEKVRERALLDRSLGRRSSPREVAKEIARELYWRVTNASQPLLPALPQAPVLLRRQYPLEGRRRRSAGQ